jgi:hypothetical protein
VSRRRVLEAVFVLLEFSSPSRRIFIGSHSLPPSLVRRIGPSDLLLASILGVRGRVASVAYPFSYSMCFGVYGRNES